MATRALIKRTLNPTYEELGALLIAAGTEMMHYNVPAAQAWCADHRLMDKMMECGIDAERAEQLVEGLTLEDVITYYNL